MVNPAQMKRTTIKGYDKKDWMLIAPKVMERGLALKFGQNQDLKEALLQTGMKKLVEASPTDRYWGIGVGLNSTELTNSEKWGQNKLGDLLMVLRNIMRT